MCRRHTCWSTVFPGQVPDSNGSLPAAYFRDGSRRFHALRIPHQGTFELTVIMG
ncbi:hypothetical protein HD597_008626 [Nonomuraea thailandensis]|uniref:Uncharacterized protein n=1 Tax=Nonomuraea thailandensis TaxID=1188745 RepID=A0A9X2GTQ7_9ACTN|nr:hypothetical protein [Nonomuraea thailandensis]MCP2361606.1 hypothetical protein [Nonomuraea thailandensis]